MKTLDLDADDGRLRKRIEFEAEKVSQAQRNAPLCNQREHDVTYRMESQTVALHFPSAFGSLSEIILRLANAFGGTSNTVCPISNFVFPN